MKPLENVFFTAPDILPDDFCNDFDWTRFGGWDLSCLSPIGNTTLGVGTRVILARVDDKYAWLRNSRAGSGALRDFPESLGDFCKGGGVMRALSSRLCGD